MLSAKATLSFPHSPFIMKLSKSSGRDLPGIVYDWEAFYAGALTCLSQDCMI